MQVAKAVKIQSVGSPALGPLLQGRRSCQMRRAKGTRASEKLSLTVSIYTIPGRALVTVTAKVQRGPEPQRGSSGQQPHVSNAGLIQRVSSRGEKIRQQPA